MMMDIQFTALIAMATSIAALVGLVARTHYDARRTNDNSELSSAQESAAIAEAVRSFAGATAELYGPIRAELAELRRENGELAAKLDLAYVTIQSLRDQIDVLSEEVASLREHVPHEVAEEVARKAAAVRRRSEAAKAA